MQAHSSTSRRSLLFVSGTRGESARLAPVILAARAHGGFEVRVCTTTASAVPADGAFDFFGIAPDFPLLSAPPSSSPCSAAGAILSALAPALAAVRPSWVVVQGTSATTVAAAVAAGIAGARVAYLDPGERRSLPARQHRSMAAGMAHLPLAGDFALEALSLALERLRRDPACRAAARSALLRHGLDHDAARQRPLVLVHMNGGGQGNAIVALCKRHAGVDFVVPLHPGTAFAREAGRALAAQDACNLTLCAPLGYLAYAALLGTAAAVLTDSASVHAESCALGRAAIRAEHRGLLQSGEIGGAAGLAPPSGHPSRLLIDAIDRWQVPG
jgi:UDP-N-acetylglucosamine 2-epimerase (non-hydrolysing)